MFYVLNSYIGVNWSPGYKTYEKAVKRAKKLSATTPHAFIISERKTCKPTQIKNKYHYRHGKKNLR
jgi:hypothetical protein